MGFGLGVVKLLCYTRLMSLKKAPPQRHPSILMSLGIAVILACAGFAHAEEVSDAPKESMFQAGKSYFSRASDRLVDSVSEKSESLINQAMAVIGVRYRWNAELPQSGLDGSSFVAYVFKDKLGFLLPNKSTQMSRVGKPINRDDLQPGDLVFFNTMRLTFSHVGIYVGDNKFIHSPSKGASVRVDDLGSVYWDRRFDGARRLDGSDSLDDSERRELLNQVNNIKRKPQSL